MLARPEVFALVPVGAGLSPQGVALPAHPAVVSVATEPAPGVDVLAAETVVAFVPVVWVAEPVAVSVADVASLQVSVDIPVACVLLVPVAGVVVEVDSSGRPTCLAAPNADQSASSSSSVAVVGAESVDSPTGARTTYDLGSILAIRDRHQSKTGAPGHNIPTPGHSTGSDTTPLPRDATTTHSRRTSRPRDPGQRTHRSSPASGSLLVERERQWGVAGKCQCLRRPLPWQESDHQIPTS